MNRIINNADFVVEDMLRGILKAESGTVAATENPRVIKYVKAPVPGKVGLVTGGGSGHEPTFLGYVGENLCDAAAVGEVFSSPSPVHFYEAIKAADGGRGVVCLYGNYAGDNMNVHMAIRKAQKDGITVKTVVASDDAASAPEAEKDKRRGGASLVFLWKIAGTKAALGADIDEVVAVGEKVIQNARAVSIGTRPCTIPAVGHPNFTIEDGTVEIGVGIHGEAGARIEPLKSANDTADQALQILLDDLDIGQNDEAAVLVSGLGATPLMEQYIFYDRVEEILCGRGISVYKAYVGNYVTSLEMMGITMSVLKLDGELKALLDMPARSMGFRQP